MVIKLAADNGKTIELSSGEEPGERMTANLRLLDREGKQLGLANIGDAECAVLAAALTQCVVAIQQVRKHKGF
jgi:hypothetical protein